MVRGGLLALLLVACPVALPAGLDLHRYWDDRCLECHGHAGDFARDRLRVSEGVLIGSSADRDLKVFLRNHYPAEAEVDDIYAMLVSQVGTRARFKTECSACHGSAVALVRDSIEHRDGSLVARGAGRPLADFLVGHAGLAQEDARFYLRVLQRIHGEVNR